MNKSEGLVARSPATIVIVVALAFAGLWTPVSGTHPDEAWYLSVSAEMRETGAWLTPTIEGEPAFFKPPLLYWLHRVSFGVFGFSLFSARLSSALAAIALAVVVAALARRFKGDPLVAFGVTATSFGVFRFGHVAMMDVPMTLALAGLALCVVNCVERGEGRKLLLAGVCASAAVMLKGPVGLVLSVAIGGGYLVVRGRTWLKSRYLLGAVAIFGALTAPWVVSQWLEYRDTFIEKFLTQEHLGKLNAKWRFTDEFTLLGFMAAATAPWLLLVASGFKQRPWSSPERVLPTLIWVAVLVIYSLPASKQLHYAVPCVIAGALVISTSQPERWALRMTAALLALVSLGGLVAMLGLPSLSAGVAVVAFAFAAVALWRSHTLPAVMGVGVGLCVVYGVLVPGVVPPFVPPELTTLNARLSIEETYGGVYWLASSRRVHRTWGAHDALQSGAAVIMSPARWATENHEGLEVLLRWPRIRARLGPTELFTAWREHSLSGLTDDVVIVKQR